MEFKSTILKILNIEKSEVKYVLWTVLYSFFLGASIAYFFAGSTSLFLNSFEREMIPLSFIIAGVIVIGVGQVYSYIQKNYQYSFSVLGALAFMLLSVVVFIILFSTFNSVVVIFALYAWNRVFAYIHNVVFWGMAGKLFSLQQAKRVFGLISGGEVVGLIVAFFSIPILLKIISTEDLLYISTIFLFVGFVVLLIIVKRFKVKLTGDTIAKKKSIDKKTLKKTSFFQSKYYKLFFAIAFIPIFAQFFVDFVFQAQVKLEFPDKESLTAFVGIFFGIGAIVEFFLKTFISGRLLSRYGMKFGLLAFPIVLAISFVLATSFGLIYGAASLFFSFVALGRLFTRAVRTSFNDPATQILYQPLPADERIAFQNKVESGPKAYASIFAGVLLYLFAKIPGFSLVYFSAFLLLIVAIWHRSATAIYKEYRDVLHSILSKKNGELKDNNRSGMVDLLRDSLLGWGSLKPNTIVRLFRLVIPYKTDKLISETEKVSADTVAKKVLKFSRVIELSKSENPDDRVIAARNMTKYSIYKVEKPIIRLLHDENFDVKCEAVIATGKMRESELFYHLVTLFQNPQYKEIVSAAMINIGEVIVPELDHNFQKTEYDVTAQLKTVELIEKIGGEKSIEFLVKNLNHHNKLVSDRIINTLGKLNFRAERNDGSIVWQKLEKEIKHFVSITSALINIGRESSENELYTALVNEQLEKKRKIFSLLSVLYDPKAINLIAKNLETKDKNSSGFAIEIADMILSDMHKPMLLPLLESQFNFEIVSKYMLYFPTEKMNISSQLIDIINSEYWVTGFYTKSCAIKMLSSINDVQYNEVLIANMVHPNKMIWQLASFYLHQKNSELFLKEVNQNFPKVNGLKEFSEEIDAYVNGAKRLIFSKLIDLRKLPLFDGIKEEDLIDLSTSSIDLGLIKDESFETEPEQTDFYIILSGEIIDDSTGLTLSRNNVICPFLTKSDKTTKYRTVSEHAKLIIVKMHFITNLFGQNINFAEELIKILPVEEI